MFNKSNDSDTMSFHRGNYIQRGRGLGGFLSSLLTGAKEVGRKILSSPITKNVMNAAKKSAIEAGIAVATDTLKGKKKFSKSVKDNVNVAKSAIADAVESSVSSLRSQIGKGKKRKGEIVTPLPAKRNKSKPKKIAPVNLSGKKKKKFNDIFS
jgi:hypothetical protein